MGVWPESENYSDDGMHEMPKRLEGACEIGTQFNSSMCNKKLIGAHFLSKGLMPKNLNITVSMNSACDTNGHETQTSSTAARNFVEGAL
uniref:Subtilisin-like protease SBT1.9 n=1 Tax=Rhizophora mucronata TaxID=61149 RepID=A0A2P2MQF2_RHIMU